MIEPLLSHRGIITWVMVCLGIGPLIAVTFLPRQRSKARASRCPAIDVPLLLHPSQTLRQQLSEEQPEIGWDRVLRQAQLPGVH